MLAGFLSRVVRRWNSSNASMNASLANVLDTISPSKLSAEKQACWLRICFTATSYLLPPSKDWIKKHIIGAAAYYIQDAPDPGPAGAPEVDGVDDSMDTSVLVMPVPRNRPPSVTRRVRPLVTAEQLSWTRTNIHFCQMFRTSFWSLNRSSNTTRTRETRPHSGSTSIIYMSLNKSSKTTRTREIRQYSGSIYRSLNKRSNTTQLEKYVNIQVQLPSYTGALPQAGHGSYAN
jgi:hypothetical protein